MDTGTATGGPLDGRQITVRRPRGILLVDRPAKRAWIYDTRERSGVVQFICRHNEGLMLDDEKRIHAAETDGGEFDVIAAPLVGGP
jgi:hypothetical protein